MAAESDSGWFAPRVVVDGVTITPPGWMWVLAFALNGCKWAIETADTDEFRSTVRDWLRIQHNARINERIACWRREIVRLKAELVP
jgi:hypothetical protein